MPDPPRLKVLRKTHCCRYRSLASRETRCSSCRLVARRRIPGVRNETKCAGLPEINGLVVGKGSYSRPRQAGGNRDRTSRTDLRDRGHCSIRHGEVLVSHAGRQSDRLIARMGHKPHISGRTRPITAFIEAATTAVSAVVV